MKKKPQKILFYRETAGIGDVVMMLRAIELTKLKHPNVEIIVQTRYNDLIKYHPAIDYYADLNTGNVSENIDIRIDNSFYCAEYEAKHTPILSISRHQLFCENTAKILSEHGLEPIEYDGKPQNLYISRELDDWARSIVKNTVSGTGRFITSDNHNKIPVGVFGKSKEEWKTYPRMRDLIKLLLADKRLVLFYFDDKEQLPIWNVNQFIDYPLDKIAALVAQMALVISPDSAGLHIAGGFNVPMLGIFGPTNPLLLIAHYFQASWIPVKCLHHPCGYNVCKELRCLNTLKPKQIYNAIDFNMIQKHYQQNQPINIVTHNAKRFEKKTKSFINLPNHSSDSKQKIVIVRMKGIGDILMTWFGLEVLRKHPDTHITYVTSKYCSDLFHEQHDLVDHVYVSAWDYEPRGIPKLPAEIRNIPHDRIVELDNRIDFHDTIEKTLGDRKFLHTSPRADNFARCMGINLDNNIYHRMLKIPEEMDRWACKFLVENDLADQEDAYKLVCCQLDAKGATRQWHIDRWIQLSKLLVEKGYGVVWFSLTPEHRYLKLDGVLNLSCQTSLSQMIALMSKCRYAISTCSASVHIAHRLSKTIPIGIYGSTDYKLLAAYYDDLIPITNYSMDCAPCADWGHECLGQPGAPWCINQISPRKVLRTIK